MNKLYEIVGQMAAIDAQIAEQGGELSEELEATLAALEGALDDKVDNVCKMLKNWEHEADLHRAQAGVWAESAKKLKDKATSLDNNVAKLKHYLAMQLDQLGQSKHKTTLFSVSVRSVPRAEITAFDDISPEYLTYEVKADKKALLTALKAGVDIKGAALEYTKAVTIR